MTFSELGVDNRILEATNELGFKKAMPVQAEVLPILLSKKTDLIALAQTGTGKTAAFGIPTIQNLDFSTKTTEALVLAPTRELCVQISNDLKLLAKYIPECTIVPVYGGASIEKQQYDLKRGAKIVVATPGRMLDLIKRKYVDISNIRQLVLDEADEMLDMGFKDELDAIISSTNDDKSVLLFSATMPKEVERIARSYMNSPIEIQVGERNSGSSNVKHYYYLVQAKDRYLALKRIVDYYPNIYGIVFCRTRNETQEISNMLIKDGYNADALHGDLSQAQREHVMTRFRCKNLQLLVATDVAARGLDVNNLTHVINYNLPDDIEQYTHRSGRTGRADKTGLSIAIINLREKYKIKTIEKAIKQTFVQAKIPNGMEVCEKQLFNMIDKIENVEVNYTEIEKFLPVIFKKLESVDKEELIRKVVSLEFNRFLEYYKNTRDLNVEDRPERGRNDRDRNDRGDSRRNNSGNGKRARLFLNFGGKDNMGVPQIIGLINDLTQNRDVVIGKIDIHDSFSFVEIPDMYVDEVLRSVNGARYRNRRAAMEVASARQSSGSREDRGSRNRQDSRGNERREEGRSRKRQDSRDSGHREESNSRNRKDSRNNGYKEEKRQDKKTDRKKDKKVADKNKGKRRK